MGFFMRRKRPGESRMQYKRALHEFVEQCLAKEFPAHSTQDTGSQRTMEEKTPQRPQTPTKPQIPQRPQIAQKPQIPQKPQVPHKPQVPRNQQNQQTTEALQDLDAYEQRRDESSDPRSEFSQGQGVPLSSEGVPQFSEGVPLSSEGVPQFSEGVPKFSEGVPQSSERVPQSSEGDPLSSEGVPHISEGVPQSSEGVPQPKDSGGSLDVSRGPRKQGTRPRQNTTERADEAKSSGSPTADDWSTAHQMQPALRYKRTGGTADGAGESYEWKMLTLIFLRMLSTGVEFQLASNMEAAGQFDDIVLRVELLKDPVDKWTVSYMQLKHKQKENKFISRPELLGITGDFSLAKYCVSYASVKSLANKDICASDEKRFIIFTTVSIDDRLVDEVESDPLLSTGGKVVSFKAGGEVYRELCEWVVFKEALTELLGQADGKSSEELGVKIKDALEGVMYNNKAVTSWRDELLKSPTLVKLQDLLKKLAPVSDKATYSSFLAELRVYTNQAHESQLDAKIKEQLAKVWISSDNLETDNMLHVLQSKVKSWWQKDNVHITQDSPLWLSLVKSHADHLSESTIAPLTKSGAEFAKDSLRVLHEAIPVEGVVNVRVESGTAASSLRVHQALAEFRGQEIVLHVNLQAFLEREADVLAAWASRWCRVLVLECDKEIGQSEAERTAAKLKLEIGGENSHKLLVLIAPESHQMNVLLQDSNNDSEQNQCQFAFIEDSCQWDDLTDAGKKNIFEFSTVNMQGFKRKLSELPDLDKTRFGQLADLEVISQLLTGVTCGKVLDKKGENFVKRRLKCRDGAPFAVNSVRDVGDKVVLLSDVAGMGKSTLVTHLADRAQTEDHTAWIVHIKLNDCAEFLEAMDKKNINEEAARGFLEHFALSTGNVLEKFLFRSLEHKLVIFLDGVDEVCPDYQKQVFTLLGFISEFKFAKLWVASRPLFQDQLESQLRVSALRFDPLSDKEQTELFTIAWRAKDVSEDGCREKTSKLRMLLDKLPEKDREMLGVPLLTAMVAEVYHTSEGELVKNGRLDKTFLYVNCVEQRFNVLYFEKMKTENPHGVLNKKIVSTLKERIHRGHCLAALRVLFCDAEIGRLKFEDGVNFGEDLAAFLKEVADGKEKTGIIDYVVDGSPVFTHRSLSEYFTALWLKDNFERNTEFTKRITTNPSYSLIGEMFNRLLSGGHPLHAAVLDSDVQEAERLLAQRSDVDAVDAGGRTPLHLAVLVSATDPHKDCVRIVSTLTLCRARPDVADTIAGWTPLQYAEQVRAWEALYVLLQMGAKGNEAWPRPVPDLMLDAARDSIPIIVRYLVEDRRGKLDCRGLKGETMVHSAAEGGRVRILEFLFSKELFFGFKDNEGNTALHRASHKTVRFLLEHGLDLDAVNNQCLTALQVAAQNGAYDAMAALLEFNASFQPSSYAKNRRAQLNACLLCAAFAGSLESVQKLLKKGAAIDHRDDKGHTAVWLALQRGHLKVMDWLLTRKNDRDTPLTVACRLGEPDVVAFILSRGADIEGKGLSAKYPEAQLNACLLFAAFAGSLESVQKLVEKGASYRHRDRNGHTAAWVAWHRGHVEVMDWLLTRGYDGDTPLHTACRLGEPDLVAFILSRGADIEGRRFWGHTPLVAAAEGGHLAVAELLLEKGADVEGSDTYGENPLHWASKQGNVQVAALLLRHRAGVNAKDKKGWTPLHHASYRGRKPVVTLLLKDHQADVRCTDDLGRTPLDLATLGWHSGVVKLLTVAGGRREK